MMVCIKLAYALDPPHNITSDPDINCGQCHYVGTDTPEEDWWDGGYSSLTDTPRNRICLGCHNDTSVYNGKVTDKYKTHSSYIINSVYDYWDWECIDCHNPHYQRHLRIYRSSAFINTGTMTGITADADPTVTLGTALSKDYENYMFIPNSKYYTLTYKIINSTDGKNSFKIRGPVKLAYAPAGSTYAIVYGRYAHETINGKAVKLFRREGANSLADGDGNYDGVCEVCHTQTQHFRGDGSAPDQKHENLSADASSGIYCIQCHSHTGGFAHGGGSGSDSCGDCHGKHADHGGVGTTQSHATHLESDSHGVRGPKLGDTACDECHDTANFPRFKDGQDLAGTTACDPCHSDGGSYNGVDSTGNSIGAKDNWRSGVYIANSVPAEKERWCAGCHDTGASVINSVSAPPVIGNETVASTYGTGWGYYKTGHGLASDVKYPFSGIMNGAGMTCDVCHDYSLPHVDGDARTYDCSDGCDAIEYKNSYRLANVAGGLPMNIPQQTTHDESDFRLCYSCHDSGPLMNNENLNTNFRPDNVNYHPRHMNYYSYMWHADWNFGASVNSYATCMTCHNVHGSERLAMIRDGKLINREPGMEIWYYNENTFFSGSEVPVPENVPLGASLGFALRPSTIPKLCGVACHASTGIWAYARDPFQDTTAAPELKWTGEPGFVNDGAAPNSGMTNTPFTFRVRYSDMNNDAPAMVELWLDENDNDVYEPGERHTMKSTNPATQNFFGGVVYALTLDSPGIGGIYNTVNYRFFANSVGPEGLDATGAPMSNSTVTFNNYAPVLDWAGGGAYATDGVNPDSGREGAVFVFAIKYTDYNNDAPGVASVIVDGTPHALSVVGGDTDFTDGAIMNASVIVGTAGSHNYRFELFDEYGEAATGVGLTNLSFEVVSSAGNNAPVLEWTGEGGYINNGVSPDVDAEERKYTFRVRYTDADNDAPAPIQVWVDEDDSNTYEPGERYDMDPVDSEDLDYSDGKLYTKTMSLSFTGAGAQGTTVFIDHAFYAHDGTDAATGAPASNELVGIINGVVVPDEAATVQAGINAANDGDYIVVRDGTYNTEPLFMPAGESLTLISINGPSVTIINGGGPGSAAIKFACSGSSLVEGVTLADSFIGADITCSDTVLRNVIVDHNRCGIYGKNQASASNLLLEDSLVKNNGDLMGIWFRETGGYSATIKNTTFTGNYSGGNGGAFATAIGSKGTVTIVDSLITGNTSPQYGGGFYAYGNNQIYVYNTTISGNNAANAGGISLETGPSLYMNNSIVEDNTATFGGGGIHLKSGTYAKITNSIIRGNEAETGAGMVVVSTADLVNVIITGNYARAGSGGGIYNIGTTNLLFSTVSSNATDGTAGGGIHKDTGFLFVTNSIVYNNYPNQLREGGYISNTMINENPFLFTDQGGNDLLNGPDFIDWRDPSDAPTIEGDYHISVFSNAIDAGSGNPTVLEDMDGDSRPQGAGYDMGADEYAP